MQPLRIRINRIVDFGTVVSLVGIDTKAAMPVTIHVDHRPFSLFSEAWRESGLAQPIEYEADRLMRHLDMLPADDGDEVRLVELDGAGEVTASGDQPAVQEMDR
jgi:hypothetical protein